MTNADMITHPPHYISDSGIECIDVIRYFPHCLATACKYVWRYRDKWNPKEDLGKANFYLNDYEEYLFKNKETDTLMHVSTIESARYVMDSKVREQFRKHIVFLNEKFPEEGAFFEAVYQYLYKAQHGVVSHDLYLSIPKALAVLEEHAESFPRAPERGDLPDDLVDSFLKELDG